MRRGSAWATPSCTPTLSDAELYRHGAETLLASWEQCAQGAPGAKVWRVAGVDSAVFPNAPERGVYNNALLDRGLSAGEQARAISAMDASYEAAGVTRFAAWVHESDDAMRSDLERQGYTIDETTRAMGMTLDDIRLPPPQVELGPADWSEHLRLCCRAGSSVASIPRRFRFWWHGLAPRMSRPRSRCITPVTAGSTTSGHSSMRANADWRPG